MCYWEELEPTWCKRIKKSEAIVAYKEIDFQYPHVVSPMRKIPWHNLTLNANASGLDEKLTVKNKLRGMVLSSSTRKFYYQDRVFDLGIFCFEKKLNASKYATHSYAQLEIWGAVAYYDTGGMFGLYNGYRAEQARITKIWTPQYMAVKAKEFGVPIVLRRSKYAYGRS